MEVPLAESGKITIAVVYKADYCLPCPYMDETVREILPEYNGYIDYQRIDFMQSPGRERFLEISCELFGEEAVWNKCRSKPVQSILYQWQSCF